MNEQSETLEKVVVLLTTLLIPLLTLYAGIHIEYQAAIVSWEKLDFVDPHSKWTNLHYIFEFFLFFLGDLYTGIGHLFSLLFSIFSSNTESSLPPSKDIQPNLINFGTVLICIALILFRKIASLFEFIDDLDTSFFTLPPIKDTSHQNKSSINDEQKTNHSDEKFNSNTRIKNKIIEITIEDRKAMQKFKDDHTFVKIDVHPNFMVQFLNESHNFEKQTGHLPNENEQLSIMKFLKT
jgi:hypothetical protein